MPVLPNIHFCAPCCQTSTTWMIAMRRPVVVRHSRASLCRQTPTIRGREGSINTTAVLPTPFGTFSAGWLAFHSSARGHCLRYAHFIGGEKWLSYAGS